MREKYCFCFFFSLYFLQIKEKLDFIIGNTKKPKPMFSQVKGQAFFHRKHKAKPTKRGATPEKIIIPQLHEEFEPTEESGKITPHFKLR